MTQDISSVLHVDLGKKEHVIKSYPDYKPFIGGIGLASKLILDLYEKNPIVIAIGPLNGLFPFVSKTCLSFVCDGKFVDTYGGGRLSTRLKFAGIDAIVFEGKASQPTYISISENEVTFVSNENNLETLGIPGKRSVVKADFNKLIIDKNFSFGDSCAVKKLEDANVLGFVVSATSNRKISDPQKYEKQYNDVLSMVDKMQVVAGSYPSCSGCPMGCEKASVGENGGNVLVHSLVGCIYAEEIYSNISTVFACLNSVGYDFVHEDIEALSELVYSNIKKVYEKKTKSKMEGE